MIARIESNCETGQVRYLDENDVEIEKSVAEAMILEGQQNLAEGNEPLASDEPSGG